MRRDVYCAFVCVWWVSKSSGFKSEELSGVENTGVRSGEHRSEESENRGGKN